MKEFILLTQLFVYVYCENLCDLYQISDLDSGRQLIYTIAGYQVPTLRGTRIEANVSCPCDENLCLRKCCLPDDVFNTAKICQFSDASREPKAPDINYALNIPNSRHTTIIYGSFCPSAIVPIDNSTISSLNIMEYCVDYFADIKEYKMLQCSDFVEEVPKIYTICFGISVVSLSITFFVYFFIPNLCNLPGKILLGYVASLLITDIFFLILQIMVITEGIFCLLSASIIQFSFLASFFWLNVMCLDLWWTFSSGYRALNGLSKEEDRRKFLIYCLYAWGCPAIITIITIIIDHLDVPHHIKPKLGEGSCGLGDNDALFYYFYSFISVILVINFIMFIHTTVIITRHNKNEGSFLRGGGNRIHSENEKRFYVYLKLYSIMGINWLLEILSFYNHPDNHPDINPDGGYSIWDVIDIWNTLQGTMIFVMFVCKRKVIILLNKKLYPGKMFIKENVRSSSIYSSGTGSIRVPSKTEMVVVHSSENVQSDFVI